jgi:AcrR family transcriptional regulator
LARKPAELSVSREDILLAAADVLQKRGYEATTMKDIAGAVDLTAASLYHHFRNKDELLLAVLEAGLETVLARLEPIRLAQAPPEEKLRRMIHEHVVGVAQNTSVGAAMVFEIRSLMNAYTRATTGTGKLSPAERDAFLARRDAFFARRDAFEESFRQVIRDGIAAGVFRPVDVPIFVKTLLGAHNWVGVWYRPGGRLSGEAIAAQMAETFLRALMV